MSSSSTSTNYDILKKQMCEQFFLKLLSKWNNKRIKSCTTSIAQLLSFTKLGIHETPQGKICRRGIHFANEIFH